MTIGKITAASFCTLEWQSLGIHHGSVFAELLTHFFSADSAHWNWKSNWRKGLAQICCPVKIGFEVNDSAVRFSDALFCWGFFNRNFSFKYCADLCVIKIHAEKTSRDMSDTIQLHRTLESYADLVKQIRHLMIPDPAALHVWWKLLRGNKTCVLWEALVRTRLKKKNSCTFSSSDNSAAWPCRVRFLQPLPHSIPVTSLLWICLWPIGGLGWRNENDGPSEWSLGKAQRVSEVDQKLDADRQGKETERQYCRFGSQSWSHQGMYNTNW